MNADIKAKSGGFSLVELMIAMAIGLIVMLAITQAYLSMENRRRTIVSDNDSQTAGMLTLYMVEREIRNSGFAIPITSALGCTVHAAFAGNAMDPGNFTLAPVVISAGDDGITDKVVALSGTNGAMPLPVKLLAPFLPGDNSIDVGVNYFFGAKQLSILADPMSASDCSLVEITEKSADLNHVLVGASPWNQSSASLPASGFQSGSFIFNMGSLSLKKFFVSAADKSLRISETANSVEGASTITRILAPGIVGFKARYVFDGSGLTGPQNLVAVRIALVSRGAQAERPSTAGGACDATTIPPKWSDGTTLPILDTSPGWQCYRYKVSETTVSLRNRVWSLP